MEVLRDHTQTKEKKRKAITLLHFTASLVRLLAAGLRPSELVLADTLYHLISTSQQFVIESQC